MILTTKKRFGYYKPFEQDIWGLCFSDFRRENKVNQFFYSLHLYGEEFRLNKARRYVYKIDLVNPRRFKKPFKGRFLSLRLVKLFFLTLTYRQFRRMAYIALKKKW